MVDIKFEISYNINNEAPVPPWGSVLVMKVKADADGNIPVNVRSMDRALGEPMYRSWGSSRQTSGWRVKEMRIEEGTWPAVQAKVEENILAILARMQDADERYRRLVAEQPADYVYDTTVPGPAIPGPATPEPATPDNNDEEGEEERKERFVNNRPWAMAEFGLSELPCSAAANFLAKHFDDIVRFGEGERGKKWHQLYTTDRFSIGIKWLEAFVEANDEVTYPIHDWIEWARDHWT